MDDFGIRYNAMLSVKPVETPRVIINVALPGPFTKSDWQQFPRKLKKKVKKQMLEINELVYGKGDCDDEKEFVQKGIHYGKKKLGFKAGCTGL